MFAEAPPYGQGQATPTIPERVSAARAEVKGAAVVLIALVMLFGVL
jgi:hypothetical protein